MEYRPSTPLSEDEDSANGSCPTPTVSTPVLPTGRTPLGMRPSSVPRSSLPFSGISSSRPITRQKRFVPPTRVTPAKIDVKSEPIEIVDGDDQEPITSFEDEDNETEDIKPIINEPTGRFEGKRKRSDSNTPEGRDVKPLIPGSRNMPIDVEDVVDNEDGHVAQIPRQFNGIRPVIVRNVVYNITYNVLNNIVQSEAPPPPPYAPLPGLKPASPPPARIEEIDPDFVPRKSATAAIPSPNPNPQVIEPEPEAPVLSPAQQKILDKVLLGQSVLIHGSAGTGKSVLIRAIKKAFETRYESLNPGEPKPDSTEGGGALGQARASGDYSRLSMRFEERVANPLPEKKWKLRVTASTGLAAVNIGGTTFHSFIGAGLAKGEVADIVEIIRKTCALDEWTTTAALIIDEISMVDGEFFDKIDQVGQIIRSNKRPFGGLQIIACGDFLQLPPIGDKKDDRTSKTPLFTFQSEVWSKLYNRGQHHNLDVNYRQGDNSFRYVLERMRRGYLSKQDHTLLRGFRRALEVEEGFKPIYLSPIRKEVDAMNEKELATCQGPTKVYFAEDWPGTTAAGEQLSRKETTKRLNEETRFPIKLDLRVGAQVMLIMNMKEPFLVNGTTGCVTGYMTRDEAQKAGIPEPSLVHRYDPPRDVKYPVIRFAKMRHCRYPPPPEMLMAAMSIDIKTSRDIRVATRTQVPIILAWALTIHKAQGQTLDKVMVDVGRCFAAGQAYTAISRVTSKEGLQLLNYKLKSVMVDRVAERWVRELEGDDEYGLYAEQPED